MRFLPFQVINSENTIDSWSTAIEDGAGRAGGLYANVITLLEDSGIPIYIHRELIAPGVLEGLRGDRREFLAMQDITTRALSMYVFYLNAQDYGNNLVVNWYVCPRIGIIGRILLKLYYWIGNDGPEPNPLVPDVMLTLEQRDVSLKAFLTTCHHCVMQSIQLMQQQLGKEQSSLDQTAGFLGT